MTSAVRATPHRNGSEVKCELKFVDVVEKRALGLKTFQFAYDDMVALKVYKNFFNYQVDKIEKESSLGGIFNLEFSLDG